LETKLWHCITGVTIYSCSVTLEDIQKLRKRFKKFDSGNSRLVSVTEFITVLYFTVYHSRRSATIVSGVVIHV